MELNITYCVDNAIGLSWLDDNSIDLTVTSPPYDKLRSYNGFDWNLDVVSSQLYRITKDGGVVVWVVGDATIKGSETGTSFKHALRFKDVGFNLHDTMIYQKTNFSNPSINRYHQIFEYMFIFSKGKPKTFNPIKDKINKHTNGSLGKNTTRKRNGDFFENKHKTSGVWGMRSNVWLLKTAGQENMCKHLAHPAMFPFQLAYDHIISWSNEGNVVLDPFMGSGTVANAATSLKRNYIGFEISQEYCDIANAIKS